MTIILMGVVAVALVAIVVGMIWLLMRIDWDSGQRIERQSDYWELGARRAELPPREFGPFVVHAVDWTHAYAVANRRNLRL
ncbi:MAG TPA: hypothetical protein VFK56_07895 [Mycobacterium sp.]|nr:hypothetical protein [Mycobacterium sp.]